MCVLLYYYHHILHNIISYADACAWAGSTAWASSRHLCCLQWIQTQAYWPRPGCIFDVHGRSQMGQFGRENMKTWENHMWYKMVQVPSGAFLTCNQSQLISTATCSTPRRVGGGTIQLLCNEVFNWQLSSVQTQHSTMWAHVTVKIVLKNTKTINLNEWKPTSSLSQGSLKMTTSKSQPGTQCHTGPNMPWVLTFSQATTETTAQWARSVRPPFVPNPVLMLPKSFAKLRIGWPVGLALG